MKKAVYAGDGEPDLGKTGRRHDILDNAIYAAFMDPGILEAIVQGQQPMHLTADWLKQQLPLPMDW